MSNVIDLDFKNGTTNTPAPSSISTFGLLSSSGSRTSGQFRLDAGVGNQMPSAVKTSGSFSFYGGIQGQVVSK